MEAVRRRPAGEYSAFGEPPEEIMSEIQAGLDGIYGPEPGAESDSEVQLSSEQAKLAILGHLVYTIPEGGSYAEAFNSPGSKQGIMNRLSLEMGMSGHTIPDAILEFSKEDVLEIDVQHKHGGSFAILDLRVTPATAAALESMRVARQEDASAAERYLMLRQRETILMICKEMNYEEMELKVRLSEFKDPSSFQSLDGLYEYLASLQAAHRKRLVKLGARFD